MCGALHLSPSWPPTSPRCSPERLPHRLGIELARAIHIELQQLQWIGGTAPASGSASRQRLPWPTLR